MSNNSRPVDWLEYIRQAKQKPFDMAQLRCDFPADVIFADGLDSEHAKELFAIDEDVDTLPTFSNDRETIVKQAFGYFALEMKLRLYKKELEKNSSITAGDPVLLNKLYDLSLALPDDSLVTSFRFNDGNCDLTIQTQNRNVDLSQRMHFSYWEIRRIQQRIVSDTIVTYQVALTKPEVQQ